MKNISTIIKTVISALSLFTIAVVGSFAQTNADEALSFSNEIESRLKDFEANASEIATNESILDSQEAMDRDRGGAQNSIESAIDMLEFDQVKIDRNERTILWFEVLGAIDRHLGEITYVDISGRIRPPRGYKGKMGIDGMEIPDTNDIVNYKYYVDARRANKKTALNGVFQNRLHSENDFEATPYAEKFFRSFYLSEADKREFENLLHHSNLSGTRKKALNEAVVGTHQ
jgi:hypothetical protein